MFVGQFEIEKKGGQSLREREKVGSTEPVNLWNISPTEEETFWVSSVPMAVNHRETS
ncbi:MAG: hypothetical protein ACK518_00965 [bacterium]